MRWSMNIDFFSCLLMSNIVLYNHSTYKCHAARLDPLILCAVIHVVQPISFSLVLYLDQIDF